MPLALESFSIREYAAKMRIISMGKCFPFDSEGIRSLPPISFQKFRWWANELEILPAVEVSAPACPARAVGRGKQKAPKKRSIIEIFAVAPQIENVEVGGCGDAEEREEVEERRKEIGVCISDGEILEMYHRRKGMVGTKNRKKQLSKLEKKKRMRIETSKKEKIYASKLPSGGVISPFYEFSWKSKSEDFLKDPIAARKKKKKGVQLSIIEHKYKSIEAPKILTGKNNEDVRMISPLRSIIKNQISSIKKATVLVGTQGNGHSINSGGELVKHVSFSAKDEILGPKKSGTPKELPQLQTLCKRLSNVLASSSTIDNSSKGEETSSFSIEGPQVEEKTKDISADSIGLADRLLFEKRQSRDAHVHAASPMELSSSNFQQKAGTNSIKVVDVNTTMQMLSNLSCPKTGDSTPLPVQYSSDRHNLDSSYDEKDPSWKPLRLNFSESRPVCYLSSSYLDSSSPSVSSTNISGPMFVRREINKEDFVGLPLNSLGELAKPDSRCKFGFSNLYKHNEAQDSFHRSRNMDQEKMKQKPQTESHYSKNRLQCSPKQHCSTGYQISSGQDITQLQIFEGMPSENFELLNNKDSCYDSITREVSCNKCKLQNWTPQADEPMSHPYLDSRNEGAPRPTMRLMGTNVIIGENRKKCESFDDGKVVDVESPKAAFPLEGYSNQCPEQKQVSHSAFCASQEKPLLPLKALNQSLLSHISSLEPKLDHACFDPQSQWNSTIAPSSTTVNHLHRETTTQLHCHPPQACLNLTLKPLVHCNCVITSVESGHEKPATTYASQSIYHQCHLNSTHFKHTQSLSSSKSSSSHPLANCVHGNFAEVSSSCSTPYHPEQILNLKEPTRRKNMSFMGCPAPFTGCPPFTMSETNILTLPSPYSKSLITLPVYNGSCFSVCGSSTLASLKQHSFLPAYSKNMPASVTNANYAKRAQNRVGSKPKITYLRGYKEKKRLAERNDFIRPLKKANVFVPFKSKAISGPARRGQQNVFSSNNMVAANVLRHGTEIINADIQSIDNMNDQHRCSSESISSKCPRGTIVGNTQFIKGEKLVFKPTLNIDVDSSRPFYVSRVGPVRLRAGAKHVLKPSQNVHQESSRLIHSTISFVSRASACRLEASCKKLEEIYMF